MEIPGILYILNDKSYQSVKMYISCAIILILLMIKISVSEICDKSVCEYTFTVKLARTMTYKPSRDSTFFYNVDPDGSKLKVTSHSTGFVDADPVIGQYVSGDRVVTGDGVRRNVITINDQFPGPPIEVMEGCQVAVKVINLLPTDGIDIHWHGMHQKATPWMDGVSYVTQCPILPRQSFTYRFKAEPAGTHWYHEHLRDSRTDGLYGHLVVHARPPPVHEFFVAVSDWLIEDSNSLFLTNSGTPEMIRHMEHMSHDQHKMKTTLINGRGRSESPNDKLPLSKFSVKKGKYRFRVINAANENAFKISIDAHPLTVVASDGFELSPIVVNSLFIMPGESIDFTVNARIGSGSFWFRADGFMLHAQAPNSNTANHGGHGDHMMGKSTQPQAMHTEHMAHGTVTDQMPSMNNTEDSDHGDHSEDSTHGDHSEDSAHGDQSEDSAHGDHSEDSAHGDHSEDSAHGDHREDSAHVDHTEETAHMDHTEDPAHVDHTEDTSHVDHTEDTSHVDHTEDTSNGDGHGHSPRHRKRAVDHDSHGSHGDMDMGSMDPTMYKKHLGRAIFQYTDSMMDMDMIHTDHADNDPDSMTKNCSMADPCAMFNCPSTEISSHSEVCVNFDAVQSTLDAEALLEFGITPSGYEHTRDKLMNDESMANQSYIFFNFAFSTSPGIEGSSVNNIKFIMPSIPIWQDYTVNQNLNVNKSVNKYCDDTCSHGCSCIHTVRFPTNQYLDIVLTNYQPHQTIFNHHPIHIHGHSFAVLKIGYPFVNKTTGVLLVNNDIVCHDDTCSSPQWRHHAPNDLNLKSPPIKDTITVPANGYVIIRLPANNEGIWFAHCHVMPHLVDGMAIVIIEGDPLNKPLPSGFPQCNDYDVTSDDYSHYQSGNYPFLRVASGRTTYPNDNDQESQERNTIDVSKRISLKVEEAIGAAFGFVLLGAALAAVQICVCALWRSRHVKETPTGLAQPEAVPMKDRSMEDIRPMFDDEVSHVNKAFLRQGHA